MNIDTVCRCLMVICLLFISYVAYGFHAERVQAAKAYDSGSAVREHCRLMKSVGRESELCK